MDNKKSQLNTSEDKNASSIQKNEDESNHNKSKSEAEKSRTEKESNSKKNSLSKDPKENLEISQIEKEKDEIENKQENPSLFKSEKDKEQMENLLEELNKDNKGSTDDSKFLSQIQKKPDPIFSLYDFLFPGGKLAKLCRINEINKEKEIDLNEILRKFKFQDQSPVVILSGAKANSRGKFFAGIARACFRTDAVIVDSGIEVGVETFAMRKNIKLIGVAPEKAVKFPKINPTSKDPFELTNGHSHLFLLNSKEENVMIRWGDESKFRFNLATAIASGKFSPKYANNPKCKIVVVLLGDNEDCLDDLELANDLKLPILVTRGSELCEEIIRYLTVEGYELQKPYLFRYLQNGHFYILGSNNSEEIASFLHFFLTVTPYETKKKEEIFKNEKKEMKDKKEKKNEENLNESNVKETIKEKKETISKKK